MLDTPFGGEQESPFRASYSGGVNLKKGLLSEKCDCKFQALERKKTDKQAYVRRRGSCTGR